MKPPIVGGLLVRRDASLRLLLGKRAATRVFYPSVWDVPGGHAEPGEGAEETLLRELGEEIGVVPTRWCLRLQVDLPEPTMLLFVYAVSAWTGDPANLQPVEHAEIRWFTVDDACQLELAHPAYVPLFRSLVSTLRLPESFES